MPGHSSRLVALAAGTLMALAGCVQPKAPPVAAPPPRAAVPAPPAPNVPAAPAPRPAPTTPALALEGTRWRLVALGNGATAGATTAHVHLRAADRRVVGSTGCNALSGAYAVDGERLVFGHLVGYLAPCRSAAQERAFIDALAATARWRIDGQRLLLLDAQGRTLTQLQAGAAAGAGHTGVSAGTKRNAR